MDPAMYEMCERPREAEQQTLTLTAALSENSRSND